MRRESAEGKGEKEEWNGRCTPVSKTEIRTPMRRLDGDDRGLGRGGKRGGGKQIAKISRGKEDGERAERETGVSIISGKVRRRAVMNCGDARRAARDTRTFFTLSRLSHISLSLSLFHVLPFSLSFSACIMQKIFIASTSGVINSFLPFSRVYDGDIFFYRVSSFSSDPFHLLKLCLPATLSYGFFFPCV